MSSLKYWGVNSSQPCRTILYVLRTLKLDYEHNEVRPRVDTRAEWFKRDINRYGKIPVIEHNGVKMFESSAISRYLLTLYDTNNILYPKDLIQRQKVDSMLDINATMYRPVFMSAYWELKLNQI